MTLELKLRRKEVERTADSDGMDVGEGTEELVHVELDARRKRTRRDRISIRKLVSRKGSSSNEKRREIGTNLDLDHGHRLLELRVMPGSSVDGLRDVLEHEVQVDLVLLAGDKGGREGDAL